MPTRGVTCVCGKQLDPEKYSLQSDCKSSARCLGVLFFHFLILDDFTVHARLTNALAVILSYFSCI
jgi:hypothetical protein